MILKIQGVLTNLSNITYFTINFESHSINKELKDSNNEFKFLTNCLLNLFKISQLNINLINNHLGETAVKNYQTVSLNSLKSLN